MSNEHVEVTSTFTHEQWAQIIDPTWWGSDADGIPHSAKIREQSLYAADRVIAALATTSCETKVAEAVEAAWHDGWASCKACLTDDEAFCLTDDVEHDTWVDSATANLIRSGASA